MASFPELTASAGLLPSAGPADIDCGAGRVCLAASAQADFRAQGLWDSICRAAGVPAKWLDGGPRKDKTDVVATNVVLLPAMAGTASPASVGRGATLALNCTLYHGALGLSRSRTRRTQPASTRK